MARITSKRQLEIFECRTDDGGVGLKFGEHGPLFMGYDESGLMCLLEHVIPGLGGELDGDLYDLAQAYLDGEEA